MLRYGSEQNTKFGIYWSSSQRDMYREKLVTIPLTDMGFSRPTQIWIFEDFKIRYSDLSANIFFSLLLKNTQHK